MKFVCQLVLVTLIVMFSGALGQAESFTFTPLPLFARGLNNAGQVVGYGVAGETTYGVLYDQGALTRIFVPGSFETVTSGINNQSQITGDDRSIRSGTGSFLYEKGQFTSFFQGPGNVNTVAQGINDRGQIVGYEPATGAGTRGFLYVDGVYRTITAPGGRQTQLTGINNAGTIVGFYDDGQYRHGLLLDSSGTFTTLDVPGSVNTFLYGINNQGAIVGSYINSFYDSHGFLYQDGVFTTINIGTVSSSALYGINDQGQILAQQFSSSFLGTPVPEPAFFALLASGLIGGGLLLWRKRTQ